GFADALERTAELAQVKAELRGQVLRAAQLERDMQVLRSQLRQAQKMEAIGRLAGGIAHDFNNLLTGISGYSGFLLEGLPAQDPRRADAEQIQKAGQRAAALTRQLLTFSRQQVPAPKVIDLNAVICDLEKMLRRLIGEDIILATMLGKDAGRIRADPGQIEQVIMNLVINARDAMPRGGRISIETANVDFGEDGARGHPAARPGSYVKVTVSDTGCGMSAGLISRIFEPFSTTKEHGKGTGLGLSMVYGIVKDCGGMIRVHSEPGRGSAFKVYLPRVEGEVEREARAPAPTARARGTETILLVEDDDMVRKFVLRVLGLGGYSVLEASSPNEALRICREYEGPIHLLIADIVMPVMRGDDLARKLGAMRPEMRAMFTSGYTESSAVHREALGSEDAYIQKPIEPGELASKVRALLDRPPTAKKG
ncbi:MAG: response regulator, partial [Elusimicrobia bacterium]|nr:response regulator [Elusimicrobiota bacterium]